VTPEGLTLLRIASRAGRSERDQFMKLLYLTFFEPIVDNGIYDTQVKQLLCELARCDDLLISHVAVMTACVLGKNGLEIRYLADRHKLRLLKGEFDQHKISVKVIRVPLIVLKRWGLSFPLLAAMLLLSLPVMTLTLARRRPDIIHCRSYGATALALLIRSIFKSVKVVFDPRGFLPEEGVVTGRWRGRSFNFRAWKLLEAYLIRRSDKVIALSEPFWERVQAIDNSANCAVIYAAADLKRFADARHQRSSKRKQFAIDDRTVCAYNGSLHAWHDPILLARLYLAIRKEIDDAMLLVITGHSRDRLSSVFQKEGLRRDQFLIVEGTADEVPSYLAAADYGLVPLKQIERPSPMAVVADTMIGTKVAEYLACGLPIIVNNEVGGMRWFMERYRIGIVFDGDNVDGIGKALREMTSRYLDYRDNCEAVAKQYFGLPQTASAYLQVYHELLCRGKCSSNNA